VTADTRSGYGRGTTASDEAAGAKTLRVHEGSHGLEYLRLIISANQKHPYPQFTGKKGDDWIPFRKMMTDYMAARKAFFDEVSSNKRAATQAVDCVGITIDAYNDKRGSKQAKLCK
jgi:hypothetical protein